MISGVDCSNLSITLNWLANTAPSSYYCFRQREREKFLKHGGVIHENDGNLHSFADTYLPNNFAIRLIPTYRSEADEVLSISFIYLACFTVVDCSKGLY